MGRFHRPATVRFSAVTRRGETGRWRVRWRVEGAASEKTFAHKTVADRFRADIERAFRDGEEFDRVSLLPRSMARGATPRVAEWVHDYAMVHLPKLAPKSRAAFGDDLVALVEHAVLEGAPVWGSAERRAVREWLAGAAELADEQKGWVERYSLRLEVLDRAALSRLCQRLEVRQDGVTPLAGTTVSKRLGNAKQVLCAALDEGVIAHLDWPARRRGAERKSEIGRAPQPVGLVPSVEDLFRVVAACTTHKAKASARYRTMTAVAGCAGLRPGEVFALRVEDLVLPRDGHSFGVIRVREADGRASEVWMRPEDSDFTLPKTRGSVRDVPIPPILVRELRNYLTLIGITSGRIFVTKASTSSKHWPDSLRAACSRAGVAALAPYDLRRMYASHLAAAGVPLAEIARRMGNSVKTLLDHYILPVAGQADEDEVRVRSYYAGLAIEDASAPR